MPTATEKQLIDDIVASVGLKRADFNVVCLPHPIR